MRSKTLLVANILSTIYSTILLWIYGSRIIEAGGIEYIEALKYSFEILFDYFKMDSVALIIIYLIIVMFFFHIGTFVFGCMIGWIAFILKKSGLAKFSATLYLIATICFPAYLIFGLPITIVGFIGGGKQKKLNQKNVSE